jgi:FkbM family methyltransferase
MTANIKNIVQAALRRLDLKLVRTGIDNQKIGMEVAVKGLADRGFIPEMVLDVGAATGQWTRIALKYWPQAHYFLMEPLAERKDSLAELCSEHPNVSFLLAAAGPTSGKLEIGVLPDQLDGSSFLYGDIRRTVRVAQIDELLETGQIQQPQFMKLDVQGYELDVLRGARQTMEHCPLILLELQLFRFMPSMPLMHESIAWMVDRGFRPYEIVDILRRPYDHATGQCDILFAQNEHWLTANDTWV